MSPLMFPGGLVVIDEKHVEKRLTEFLGPGRRLEMAYSAHNGWRSTLWIDSYCYQADSALGFWDAVANALQAAYGREEIL